jgi:hypothetical protein
LLNARIPQLNEIEKGHTAFNAETMNLGPAPRVEFTGAKGNEISSELTSVALVELAQLLQQILDATSAPGANLQNLDRFAVQDSARAFALVIRAATDNSMSDITNILEFIRGHSNADGIVANLAHLIDQSAEWYESGDQDGEAAMKKLLYLKEFWERMSLYLIDMLKARHQNRPRQDIIALSKALVGKLGFARLVRGINTVSGAIAAPVDFMDPDDQRQAMDFATRPGFSGAFINPRASKGRFMRREDAEHGAYPSSYETFSTDYRNVFAETSGQNQDNTGGRPRAFAGENISTQYGQSPEEEEEEDEEEEQKQLEEQKEALRFPEPYEEEDREAKEKLAEDEAEDAPTTFRRFKGMDVPRDKDALIAFIEKLNREVPGYKQSIYKKGSMKVENVRKRTIALLKEKGLY